MLLSFDPRASGAEQSFKDIAQQTGGTCASLDINSVAGSKMLTNVVAEEILKNVGGSSRGESLGKAYKEKFVNAYT